MGEQSCPGGERKVLRADELPGAPIERTGNTWTVRSVEVARQILRERDATRQAGFQAEAYGNQGTLRPPILWMDGEMHRQQRAKVARYFAPRTVERRYRTLMEERSAAIVQRVLRERDVVVDQMALRYSVEVASRVIGLTNSALPGLSQRLVKLLDHQALAPGDQGGSRFSLLLREARALPAVVNFYLRDVRPAIRARRRDPQEDVISHLVSEGYTDREILIECVTYGAAGVVTTREYINVVIWHMMDDGALRERYLAAEQEERYAILHEILRLEPIVGRLFRRVSRDFTVFLDGAEYELRAGDLVDLQLRQVNADQSVVGKHPTRVCPHRDLPRGVGEEVLSFGDGPHKCPGNSLAIQESDILLRQLLALDISGYVPPRIEWDDVIAGYALRGARLVLSER